LAMLRQTSCIGCEAIGRSLKTSKTSSKTSNIASNVSSNKKFKHYVTLCFYNEISFLRSTSPAPMGLFTSMVLLWHRQTPACAYHGPKSKLASFRHLRARHRQIPRGASGIVNHPPIRTRTYKHVAQIRIAASLMKARLLAIAEFVAHDLILRFGSLNRVHGGNINPQCLCRGCR
jgi:hypothetical protein